MAKARKPGKPVRGGRQRRHWLGLFLVLASALGPAGCTRNFFRNRADQEVDEVLKAKDVYPAWKIEQFHVYPDPRARFADPTNPDRPPMPPDDPAAYNLSPNPQKPGKAGIGWVEGQGYLELLTAWDSSNRAARAAADKDDDDQTKVDKEHDKGAAAYGSGAEEKKSADGSSPPAKPFLITLEQAVELGLINSREYQDRREDLYLTALPVTQQRFAFSTQWFAAEQAARERIGREAPEGGHNRWNTQSNLGFAKLFSTGALLLFNVANQTVFEFGNTPRSIISSSTLSLDLFQPLLRGGGRAVTLEPLTQAERGLLYQIRLYARFRKEFFVAIAGGGGGSISGGSFVPQGVIVNSVVNARAGLGGSGLFPGRPEALQLLGANLPQGPGSSGALFLSGAIPAPVSGYLGTLLQFAQIAIDKDNIANLERFLRLFQAFKEGGEVSQLQVDQIEQQLLQGRSTLLGDEQQYGNQLDQFRLQLGLPVNLPLELDDTALQSVNRQFRRYEAVLRQFDEASQQAAKLSTEANLRAELRKLATTVALVRGTQFAREFPDRWAVWERDSAAELQARLSKLRAELRKLLDRLVDEEHSGKPASAADRKRVLEIENELAIGAFELALREYETQPWKSETEEERRRARQATMSRIVMNAFVLVLGQPRNERLESLRASWPRAPRVCVEGTDLLAVPESEAFTLVTQTALANRLDLMNARAQAVDAWRQLAIFANALLGVVNVQYHMDSLTPAGVSQPVNFGGSRFRQQLILTGAPPLVRMQERNNYRAALIAYQRQRRALLEAEDLAVTAVRGEVRQLRVSAENYRIQQRQVELAYLTVENSLDTFQQPPAPGINQNNAAQAAALTNQLLQAQSRLLGAQNGLLTVWIQYLNTRLQLYRDLELMPMDARGVWIDDVENCLCPPADRTAVEPGSQLAAPRVLPNLSPGTEKPSR